MGAFRDILMVGLGGAVSQAITYFTSKKVRPEDFTVQIEKGTKGRQRYFLLLGNKTVGSAHEYRKGVWEAMVWDNDGFSAESEGGLRDFSQVLDFAARFLSR